MFERMVSSEAEQSVEHVQPDTQAEESARDCQHVRIAIIGTGFAGLGMAIQLKRHGYDDFLLLEREADLGGIWRDNTYPGCACDIPSHLYSFSFALKPDWSHAYPLQAEIKAYLRQCAQEAGVLPHIRWKSALLQARWNDEDQKWHLNTAQGALTASILICGNGALNEPAWPDLPGLERFEGVRFHSSQWRHDYDLKGKRVAVIGTGASSIQFIPFIQPEVARLTLFQRTPAWIMPRQDHPIASWKQRLYRFLPFSQRLVRARIYLSHELTAPGFLHRSRTMEIGKRTALRQLHRQVEDPTLREKLTPQYVMGCKRILVSDDFYPAVSQANVELVTSRIREVQAHSILTDDGESYPVDAIICGTGFRVNEASFPHLIYGRTGQTLADCWQGTPGAYLGTTVANFPNLFLLIGPNTGLGHNSMVYMIESQITYVLDCLRLMDRKRLRSVEVLPSVQESFAQEIEQRMRGTAWASGCQSWYLTEKGHNSALWPDFTFVFRRRTRHFQPGEYLLQASDSATTGQML